MAIINRSSRQQQASSSTGAACDEITLNNNDNSSSKKRRFVVFKPPTKVWEYIVIIIFVVVIVLVSKHSNSSNNYNYLIDEFLLPQTRTTTTTNKQASLRRTDHATNNRRKASFSHIDYDTDFHRKTTSSSVISSSPAAVEETIKVPPKEEVIIQPIQKTQTEHQEQQRIVLEMYYDNKECSKQRESGNVTRVEIFPRGTTTTTSSAMRMRRKMEETQQEQQKKKEEAFIQFFDPNDATKILPKSMRIIGHGGELRLYKRVTQEEAQSEHLSNNEDYYVASIMDVEECVFLFNGHPEFHYGILTTIYNEKKKNEEEKSLELQRKFTTKTEQDGPTTRFVFSVESSEYFAFQIYVSAYAYLQSNQTHKTSWTRLLSSQSHDDLSAKFPTFASSRSLYAHRYSPINKADIIDKWFHHSNDESINPNDTIIVIDPDNWLVRDFPNHIIQDVSPGHAIGEAAYYDGWGNKLVDELWQEMCQHGCSNKNVATVGVPYVVKASDLTQIAPLWRMYSIKLKEKWEYEKSLVEDQSNNITKSAFMDKYGKIDIEWASEMFGYNFACSHLSIQTRIIRNNGLQVRDVDYKRKFDQLTQVPMIHAGRAFYSTKYMNDTNALKYYNKDDGKQFLKDYGMQVWCKCNDTAAKVIPWPIPPKSDLDFQSYYTLTLLHDSFEYFGQIPKNTTYRRDYYWTRK